MKLLLVLIAILLAYAHATNVTNVQIEGLEFLPNFLPKFANTKYCATEDIYAWKKAIRASKGLKDPRPCIPEGNCDFYDVRNQWEKNTKNKLTIDLYVTVVCSTATTCPGGVTPGSKKVEDQIQQINIDFKDTGIVFNIAHTEYKVNSQLSELPAYSGSNPAWYNQLMNTKVLYAVEPKRYLNVLVTGQRSGSSGTLLGIGTFPWDEDADTGYGGLWVNALYFGSGQKTASHEIGHNIGLWHTFHGDSEVRCNSACYEDVHSDFGDESNFNNVGDFCADTPAQPMNYNCVTPSGSDCNRVRYDSIGPNPALYNNFMSYTPDNCYTTFTPQQSMRGHCWVCDALPGYISNANDCRIKK